MPESQGDVVLGSNTQSIIYGQDDRLDVYEHPNAELRATAKSSVVALIPRSHFLRTSTGDSAIFTRPLTAAFEVCTDERFAEQPTAADCSGVLLDDDLVLTAGHCFQSDDDCEQYSFVFDYFFRGVNEKGVNEFEPMGWGDMYGCRKIVHRIVSAIGPKPRIDYAVVQLDRPATGRTPVTVRTSPLVQGEPLATIGCVSGLPFKIDSGSHVVDSREPNNDYFLLDSDTFSGSSGSGVFDAAANLVGVLVRGGSDYEERSDGTCKIPKVVRPLLDGSVDAGELTASPAISSASQGDASVARIASGEEATYVGRAIEGVCAAGFPSARLCNGVERCGDGFCSGAETRAACPADCACTAGTCAEALDETPATVGPVIVKAKRPSEVDGCSASARPAPSRAVAALALAGLGALLWRSRRRRALLRQRS